MAAMEATKNNTPKGIARPRIKPRLDGDDDETV
jgi:hypothetical protein